MNWAIFPSGNPEAATVCSRAWKAAGWQTAVLLDDGTCECDRLFIEPNYRGTAAAFNRMMEEIPDWRLVACVNDDMFPADCPAERAKMLHRGGVLQPTGAWHEAMEWCAPCPIIGRDYWLAHKPVWYEGYYHLHVDEELMDVAIKRQKFYQTKSLGIEHRHHCSGFADTLPSEKRQKNNERHAADLRLYQQRKAAGFP